MKVVLVSTHIDQTTGYSKVSSALVKQLAALSPTVKTYHFGFQRHPAHAGLRKYPDGVKSYDAAANEDPKEEGFGFNKILDYVETVEPDLVMIYNDPITIYRFLEALKHERGTSTYKLWLYIDQVYEGIAQPIMDSLFAHADRMYAFSPKWKQTLETYGKGEIHVLEHAVDPLVVTAMSAQARTAIRQTMKIPDDAVVLFNANRNSQRKRLDLTIQGFVRAVKAGANLVLILATGLNPQQGAFYDVQRIFLEEVKEAGLDPADLSQRFLLIDTGSEKSLLDDAAINQLYNASDLGINTSDGEGYGLCQLEHLYTGAPQIVTDIGTYRTFLPESVATFIPRAFRAYFAGGMPHGGWYPLFDPEAVGQAILDAVGRLPAMRKAASEIPFRSWSTICDGWLESILTLAGGPASTAVVRVPSGRPSA
jgi:glycosyltransferase involved in cell wall biosynthesis